MTEGVVEKKGGKKGGGKAGEAGEGSAGNPGSAGGGARASQKTFGNICCYVYLN